MIMKNYLTKDRYEELKRELERMKKDERAEISERLKRAKEYGDLSENSEYSDAKEAQGKLEQRIFELEEMLRNAAIIKKPGSSDRIEIGSTVEVRKDGKALKYTIVGSNEARPEANLISNESPLGRAFLGKKINDSIDVKTPKGVSVYKITKIE